MWLIGYSILILKCLIPSLVHELFVPSVNVVMKQWCDPGFGWSSGDLGSSSFCCISSSSSFSSSLSSLLLSLSSVANCWVTLWALLSILFATVYLCCLVTCVPSAIHVRGTTSFLIFLVSSSSICSLCIWLLTLSLIVLSACFLLITSLIVLRCGGFHCCYYSVIDSLLVSSIWLRSRSASMLSLLGSSSYWSCISVLLFAVIVLSLDLNLNLNLNLTWDYWGRCFP